MILDLILYGYGIGLVMVGYVSGMVVGIIFNLLRAIR